MTEKRASDSGKCGCDGGSAERAPTRRRFLVTLSALFGALAFGPRAHADPPHAHCAKVWWTLEDHGARLAGSCRCGTSVVRYVATAVAPSIETLEHAESIGSLGRKEAWRWLVGAQKYAGQPI